MNDILSEKDYQHQIMAYLRDNNGYLIRKVDKYDRLHAMDPELLIQFLDNTQPDTMATLRKIYKGDTEETIISVINAAVTAEKGSLIETLKSGIDLSSYHLDLMYTKPATSFNKALMRQYENNIFSVMEEVRASDKERIDLVIFLNGLAIISFELKCRCKLLQYCHYVYRYSW